MSEPLSLKERAKNLTPDQIRQLMLKTGGSAARATFRMKRNEEGVYPLSKAQERIRFLSQLYPDTSLYNIPLAIRLRSNPLELDRLTKVINRIVSENEILRTTFFEIDGKTLQKVHAFLEVRIEYEDISQQGSNADKNKVIEKIASAHGQTIFDLSRLPLFSVKLLYAGKNDHVLLLNLHHMISDGMTNSLLARDSSQFYGETSYTPGGTEKYQYIDYVKWEQDWLASPKYSEQLAFWKNELAGVTEACKIQNDFYTDSHSYEGRKESCGIPASLHEKVMAFCQKNDATAFEFYISCYALLMSCYCGNRDLVIGTPVANRNHSHFQNTYGVFINSLPIRFKINTASTFQETFADFKRVIRQCMQNQEVPFSEMISAINPQRSLYENPLYSIHFAYQNFPQKIKSDEHALLPVDYLISKFDVNFWIEIAGEDRSISVTYRKQAIARTKINRLMNHYLNLAAAVLDRSDVPTRSVEFFPEVHKSLLTGEQSLYREATWFTLFEASVKQFENEVAFVDVQGQLTYGELSARATELAKNLTDRGVRRGDVVIVRTGRNRQFVISLLACFSCEATYLPVDQGIPPERYSHILRDSGARIVLTESDIEVVENAGIESVTELHTRGVASGKSDGSDAAIAYVIYTSGSTGKSKGVCVPHRALLNYTHSMRRRINDSSIRSFGHVSSLDADLGNTSIFLALGFGGTLVMPNAEALLDPGLLAECFRKYPVDALKIVPTHLNALSERVSGILPGKLLICGGERLSPALITDVRNSRPQLRIINHYGPTEATIGSLTFEVPENFNGHVVPVGRPIDNSSVLILDQDLKMVPQGVPGEICLAGDNVATGYLRQPALSAASFICDPALASSAIYRTGDLGYLNEEGQVVYLDRMDRQIKINGFRIELGEIESVLKTHDSVTNAAVFLFGDKNERQNLCAAVMVSDHTSVQQLTLHLARYFSPSIIPLVYVIKEIPITRNGKVDVERLKSLCMSSAVLREQAIPSDLVELRLLEIFKSALNIPVVHPEDQFFKLGGHSLLAIKMIAQINKAFQTDLRIAVLFRFDSVRKLASLIRKERSHATSDRSPYVMLMDKARDSTIAWIHPAGGEVMSYYPIAAALSADFDSVAFTAIDHHLKENLSIQGLASEYSDEMQLQRSASNTILAGWSMGALIAHEMAVCFSAKGLQPPLILVDQPVPHHGYSIPQSYEKSVISYIEKIGVFAGEDIRLACVTDMQVDYGLLYREFIRLTLMPAEVTMAEFRTFLDINVKHNNIISKFNPSIYRGPTLLLKAAEKIMLKTSNPQPEYFLDDLGWGAFCPNLTIVEVPGNHITILSGNYAASTAKVAHEWISGQGCDNFNRRTDDSLRARA